jgi:hypothetical protein
VFKSEILRIRTFSGSKTEKGHLAHLQNALQFSGWFGAFFFDSSVFSLLHESAPASQGITAIARIRNVIKTRKPLMQQIYGFEFI